MLVARQHKGLWYKHYACRGCRGVPTYCSDLATDGDQDIAQSPPWAVKA